MLLHAFYPATIKTFYVQQFFLFHKTLTLGTFLGMDLAGGKVVQNGECPMGHLVTLSMQDWFVCC